ncbi:MAG: hypothetical protein ACREYE_15125 [Gammaproteobacteria bacterium]
MLGIPAAEVANKSMPINTAWAAGSMRETEWFDDRVVMVDLPSD